MNKVSKKPLARTINYILLLAFAKDGLFDRESLLVVKRFIVLVIGVIEGQVSNGERPKRGHYLDDWTKSKMLVINRGVVFELCKIFKIFVEKRTPKKWPSLAISSLSQSLLPPPPSAASLLSRT